MKRIILLSALLLVAFDLASGGKTLAQGQARDAQAQAKLVEQAKLKLKHLEQVVAAYYVRTGLYPETLEILSKPDPNGIPATITPAELSDPWGRLYRYEPKTQHPKTLRPLIYTQGPDPADPKGKISNWDLFDAKKK